MKKLLFSLLMLCGMVSGLKAAADFDAASQSPFSITIKSVMGSGDTYQIDDVTLDSTIKQLKQEIQDKKGDRVENQRLIFGLRERGDNETVRDLGITKEGEVLHLVLRSGERSIVAVDPTFSVNIKKLFSDPYPVEGLTTNSTIRELKQRIQEKRAHPVKSQQLIFAGRERGNSETLRDLGIIKEGETLHLVVSESDGPMARAPQLGLTQDQKVLGAAAAAVTVAALTAAVKSIMSIRSYRRMKNKLVREYDLGNLTDLQDKVWMATFVSHRMPYFLRKLVRNNADKMLTDFTGKDPHALAHFYYGNKPSQAEYDEFIETFFSKEYSKPSLK